MRYEWDPAKARANAKKHGVRFADAVTALEDDRAVTVEDPDSEGERRYVSLGTDANGHLLVTVFTLRADFIRIISARKASKQERQRYEGD
jgi:uncharacterized DUF497 family protein